MLAGGLETGAVVLWNPSQMVGAASAEAAGASQVASLAKHTGAVRRRPHVGAHPSLGPPPSCRRDGPPQRAFLVGREAPYCSSGTLPAAPAALRRTEGGAFEGP